MSLDFPLYIWHIILADLSTQDLITLRSVNKDIHQTLGGNEIWKPIVLDRWFHQQYDDGYVGDALHDVTDFAKYYRNRARTDLSIVKSLVQICESFDPTKIREDCHKLIRLGYRAVPVLYKIRTTTQVIDESHTHHLGLRYYADLVLRSITKDRFLLKFQSMKGYDAREAERFFFDVSKMDQCYLNLIRIRNERIIQIIDKVKRSPLYHYSKPATFKVSLIIKAFNEVIIPRYNDEGENLEDDRFGPSYESCSENLSILRIYAGEVPGSTLLRLSIIQKLSCMLNIESRLSEAFLIVKDESFNNGHSYLSLTPSNGFKIYTFNYLMDRIRRTGVRDPLESLKLMVAQLTLDQIKQRFFHDLQNKHSLSHKTNRQPGSPSYFELYPLSRTEFSYDDVRYILEYNNALEIQDRDEPLNLKGTKFLEIVMNNHPLDLFIFPEYEKYLPVNQTKTSFNRMIRYLNCYEVYQTPGHRIQIGDIVKRNTNRAIANSSNDVFVVFLGETLSKSVRTLPDLHNDNLTIDDFVKPDKEYLINSNVRINLIEGFNYDIGLFFDRFDFEAYKFVENVRFKRLIHTKS